MRIKAINTFIKQVTAQQRYVKTHSFISSTENLCLSDWVLSPLPPDMLKKKGPRHWEFLLFPRYWSTYLVTKLLDSWNKLLGNCSIWMQSDKCSNMVNSHPVKDWTPQFPYLTYKNTQLYIHTFAILLPCLWSSDTVVTRNKQQPITQIGTHLLCEEQEKGISMCQNLYDRLKEMPNSFWRWSLI